MASPIGLHSNQQWHAAPISCTASEMVRFGSGWYQGDEKPQTNLAMLGGCPWGSIASCNFSICACTTRFLFECSTHFLSRPSSMLLQAAEVRTKDVCGLDMSAVDLHRWHPVYTAGHSSCP